VIYRDRRVQKIRMIPLDFSLSKNSLNNLLAFIEWADEI